mgnify:CR=1 FL=1
MSKLDLHGVKHQDVDLAVENFIYLNQGEFPLKIICGNSTKMIDLVNNTIKRIGAKSSMFHHGIILIEGWK